LGLGKDAVQSILCACESCLDQFNQVWDPNVEVLKQKCYKSSTICILWEIFEGLNNWNIVQLIPGSNNDEDKSQTMHQIVLDAKFESLGVEEKNVGAFQTEDPDTDNYYLGKWTSRLYHLEET
jgi:hypothetical protein